jgi:hypothetical protein
MIGEFDAHSDRQVCRRVHTSQIRAWFCQVEFASRNAVA